MNQFKVFSVVLVLGFAQYKSNVNAKRISEIKCDELASVVTDSRSKNPFLMQITLGETKLNECFGTLISEDFVLTSATCLTDHQNRWSDLMVQKLKLPEDQYSNNEQFGIKRIIPHELFNSSHYDMKYNIGLIQLNEKISYHKVNSISRPACLYSDLNRYSLDTYQLFGYLGPNIISKSLSSVTNDMCCNNTAAYCMCFNTHDIYTAPSFPVNLKIGNRNYIIGIMEYGLAIDDSWFNKLLKINHLIDWIESIVWPNNPSLECGQRKIKHKPLVSYGQPTYHGEFPWHIALFRENNKYLCGGSIISSLIILTAAHCVHDERGVLPANRFMVLAGTNHLIDYPIDAQYYAVKKVIVHENYNRDYLENDISLLKLYLSIEFSKYIQPICISNTMDYSNITLGSVAGWGLDEQNQQSNALLQATLPIVDEFTCRESNREFFSIYLNSRNYCAGYDNGTSVCSGDSGGAMIFEHNSQWYIRGIVSLGVALKNSDKCDITELVLFSNIPEFYGWIKQKLDDEQ